MKKVLIELPVDYVQGYLRYGHLETQLELTDEEYTEFESNPVLFLQTSRKGENALDCGKIIVNSYSIDDYGDYDFSELNYTDL